MAKQVYFEGVLYRSIRNLAETFDTQYQTLFNKSKELGDVGQALYSLNQTLAPRPFEFRGVVYDRVFDACKALNINSQNVSKRFKQSKDMTYAVTSELVSTLIDKPMAVGGIAYQNVDHLCQHTGFYKDLFVHFLNMGASLEQASIACRPTRRGDIMCDGKRLDSIEQMLDVYGLRSGVVMPLLQAGKSPQQVLDMLNKRKMLAKSTDTKRSVTYEGVAYPSIKHLCEDLGLVYSSIQDLRSKGLSLDEAVKSARRVGEARYTILGKDFNTLEEIGEKFDIPYTKLLHALRVGYTEEYGLFLYFERKAKMSLYGKEFTNEEASATLGLTDNSFLYTRSKHGSLYRMIEKRLERQKAPKGEPSGKTYEELASDTGIPVVLFYYYYQQTGSLEGVIEKVKEHNLTGKQTLFGVDYNSFKDIQADFPNIKTVVGLKMMSRSLEYGLFSSSSNNNVKNAKRVVYKGVQYPSYSALAESKGITPKTLSNRLSEGFTLEEAVETPVVSPKDNNYDTMEVFVRGIGHTTVEKELARTGLKRGVFAQRLYKGWSVEDALKPEVRSVSNYKFEIDGKHFNSLAEVARHYNIVYNLLYNEYKLRGDDIHEALRYCKSGNSTGKANRDLLTPQQRRARLVEARRRQSTPQLSLNGTRYESLRDLAIANEVSYKNLKKLHKEGVSLEHAVRQLRLQGKKDDVLFTYKGKVYMDLDTIISDFKLNPAEFRERLHAGQPINSAIDKMKNCSKHKYSVYTRIFDTLLEVADYYNIELFLLERRISNGVSLQSAVEHGRVPRYGGVTLEGVSFKTLKYAAKALGVSKLFLVNEIARGTDRGKIVRVLRKRAYDNGVPFKFDSLKGVSLDNLVYKGVQHPTVEALATATGFPAMDVRLAVDEAVAEGITLDASLDKITQR